MKVTKKFLSVILCAVLFAVSAVYAVDINSEYDFDAEGYFADVPKTHWAYSQISSLAGNDVISGDANNMFYPENYITRGEASEFISKFMKLEQYTEGEFIYSDVSEDAPYRDYAYSANEFFPLKNGTQPGYRVFEGEKILSRAELCYAVVHMIYAQNEVAFYNQKSLEKYADFKEIGEDFAPYVAIALDKGLLKAYDDNTIKAFSPVSKADFACVMFECVTPELYVDVNENGVEVLQDYGEEDTLKITVKKSGPNSLIDFYEWSFKKNSDDEKAVEEKAPNAVTSAMINPWEFLMISRNTAEVAEEKAELKETDPSLFNTPVKTTCTDYFSPYLVRAINNIDGDIPDSLDFTGGYHCYNNTSSGGSATARNAELTVKVNGVEVEKEFSGKATYIDIISVNYIQATNTRKEDGSGREVLKEIKTLHFDGDKWNFEIETEALEEVYLYEYFGAQFDLVGMGDKLTFVTDEYSKSYTVGKERIQSPDAKCRKILIEGNKIDTEIAVDSDLFDRVNERSFSSFYEGYGKTYFNVVFACDKPFHLKPGDKFHLNGYYRFRDIPDLEIDEDVTENTVEEVPSESIIVPSVTAPVQTAPGYYDSSFPMAPKSEDIVRAYPVTGNEPTASVQPTVPNGNINPVNNVSYYEKAVFEN